MTHYLENDTTWRYTYDEMPEWWLDPTQPRCDECGVHTEEAAYWCGECGSCDIHCIFIQP